MNTRWKALTLFSLLLSLPLLQACGGANAWEGTVTDSAGITVVHNTSRPIWGPGDEWTVTEELRIGTVAGEPEYQFGQVYPVGSIDTDPQGNIYVMDAQAHEVKVYDAEGVHLRTIGGPGSGPGEFSLQAFFLFIDDAGTLYVPDLGNQRVSVFRPGGEFAGSFPVPLQAGVPARWKVDHSGRVMAQLRGINVPGMVALEEGDPIVVYDTTGAVVDTVALLPKGETLQGLSEENFSVVMFAPEPTWDIDDTGSVFYAMNDQYRILMNDPDGSISRIITFPAEKTLVDERAKTLILRFIRDQAAAMGAAGPQIEQYIQSIGFAEYFPVLGQILMGPNGTLWVQKTVSPEDMAEETDETEEVDFQDLGSPDWDVFDAEGRYLGVITLPDRFAPVAVEGSHLYGVWADELDVQYVMRLMVNTSPS